MALPTLDATFASSADLPRKQMLAKWLVEELGSGSIADYCDLPERYLWAKIAVAAGGPKTEATYISLPKNYVWSDIYNAISGDIANSTVVVSGAGTEAVNGAYARNGTVGGKPSYLYDGNSLEWSIGSAKWIIVDGSTGDAVYTSDDNVTYPWQVTTWAAFNDGIPPLPTLTPQTPNHTDWSENVALGHIAAAYRGDTGNPANLATYIDWPWRYKVASIIGGIAPAECADNIAGILIDGRSLYRLQESQYRDLEYGITPDGTDWLYYQIGVADIQRVTKVNDYPWQDGMGAKDCSLITPNVIVSNAGTTQVNGTYVLSGLGTSDRPFYSYGDYSIQYDGTYWNIRDTVAEQNIYTVEENTFFPWEATGWSNSGGTGVSPFPTLTQTNV